MLQQWLVQGGFNHLHCAVLVEFKRMRKHYFVGVPMRTHARVHVVASERACLVDNHRFNP